MNLSTKSLKFYLFEKKKEKQKEKKIVFIETDPQLPFPSDTISAIQKEINKLSKDLTKDWKNASELVNEAFKELEVPTPKAFLVNRWKQYIHLLSYAVDQLKDSRGFGGTWTTT